VVDTTQLPLTQRARKAFMAGFVAFLGAAGSTMVALANGEQGMPSTWQGWGTLLGAAAGIGVTAGVATFSTRNPGQPAGGSDPV